MAENITKHNFEMNTNQFLSFANFWPEQLILLDREGVVLAANHLANKNIPINVGNNIRAYFQCTTTQFQRALRSWSRSPSPVPVDLKCHDDRSQQIYAFLLADKLDSPVSLIMRFVSGGSIAKSFVELNRELENHKITLKKLSQSKEEIEREREKAQVTLHSIGDGVITTDAHGLVEYLNPVAEQLTGWQQGEARGKHISDVFLLVNEITRKSLQDPVSRCLDRRNDVDFSTNVALKSKDGREYIIEDSATLIHNRYSQIQGAVLTFRDVTGDRLAHRQLEYLAQHDTLTSLKNRYYFGQQLDIAVRVALRKKQNNALLYVDLDEFKAINDLAGHAVGDEVIVEAAQRLNKRLRQGDILARLGGDEFGILVQNIDAEDVHRVAASFVQSMEGFEFVWKKGSFRLSCSVGVVMIDENTRTPAEAMRQVDIACYKAKQQGKNAYHFYQAGDEGSDSAQSEYRVVKEINQAILNDELTLMFQPIVAVESNDTVMYEILLRMGVKHGVNLSPGKLIAVAERFGIMQQVDCWVVQKAMGLINERLAKTPECLFSINLSGVSLGNAELLELFQKKFREYPIVAPRLVIEISESDAVMHTERASEFIKILKGLGVRFALDHFGVGFSSFTYLKHLPIDYIKINGTFVRDIVNDPVDQAMVRSVHQIAQSLGKKTIAEFVENVHVLHVLKKIGVDMAQGFYIGRPK